MEEQRSRLGKNQEVEKYFHWVQTHWTARGKPLDFEKHRYLKQIYQDQHPFLITMKSAQTGATERFITEALWLPDQYKENSIYLFPTSGAVSDMVQERIDEPLNNNSYLTQVSGRAKRLLGKHADKVGLKRMSKGFVYFRGSNKPTQITSVSGDAIFVDEVDRMVQTSIPYFDKRLEHSNRKWQRWASTPTLPNFGIHKLYLESDQQQYHIRCEECKEWQVLTFWDNIDQENYKLICAKCKKEMVPWACEAEWRATQESDIRGYHISQLYSPRLDIKKLVKESKKTAEWEVQQFYNQNLGLPYEPKGSKITSEDINACKRDYIIPYKKNENTFVGIDVGRVLHIVVMTKERIVFVGEKKSFKEVDDIINEYNAKMIVIDALPETRKSQELANRFSGRTYLCYYSGINEVKEGKWFKTDIAKVNTDRTLSLDILFDRIKKQDILMPKNIDDYVDYINQLKNLIRTIRETKRGQVAEYTQIGPDHYAHATNYANIAKSIFENVVIPEVFMV